ncbi:hypothetical protein E5673_12895 [Sphingomonas sp. PAMC26645]|uniref:hypothetical protein n=1 Tax=Sphingomonas sp. PAMC26645 TaxID=2565555 RepID=UPI00109DC3DA|nr:hypothetical protein [Sphingomonas sp. PAMC26645]QCB43004.1 hypothetical protein E5673_12895 [Sphingomonas sp. PAMC26645]
MEIDKHEPTAVETLSQELIEGLESLLGYELQRSADAGKWSLGALLTINGGAILALLSSEARFSDPIRPGIMFAAGMLLALGSASALRADIKFDVNRARTVVRHAKRVIDKRSSAPKTVDELQDIWEKGKSSKLLPLLPGIFEACSALLFLVGAVWAIANIDPGKAANLRRCEALQTDMLRARGLRPDSKEIFVALGCRPRGEGSVFAKPRTPALPHQDRTRGS